MDKRHQGNHESKLEAVEKVAKEMTESTSGCPDYWASKLRKAVQEVSDE
jgi:hypothetical protein